MKKLSVILSMLALICMAIDEVCASSVGGGIYIPVQQMHSYPSGNCHPGGNRGIVGLANSDGATAPPCAANGTCRPKSDTYGYYQQKWRSWPGEEADSEPQPTLADEDVIDPPAPEKEDLQAPPAIEDSVEAAIEANQPPPQPLDIQLPPLPKQPNDQPKAAPANRPPPVNPPGPGREAPPVLPFGWNSPPENKWKPKNSADEIVSWVEPNSEVNDSVRSQGTSNQIVVNANLIEPSALKSKTSSLDGPPVIPATLISPSFSQDVRPNIRRLPTATDYRLDSGVVPTSALENR